MIPGMELAMVSPERPILPQAAVFYRTASIVLFAVLVCIVVSTFRQYGITWDEPGQNRYGSLVDRYYLALLHGRYNLAPIADDYNFGYYGGLFDSVAVGLEHISPFGEFETRHLLNAMVGLLGILGCWKMARVLGGYAAAFWAALLLAVTPRYYGPMFNNPKDIPFAVGYVWTVYFLLLAIPLLPRIPWRLCLKLGVAIGLTLGIRVGGLLLLAYVGVIQAAYLVWTGMRRKTPGSLRKDIAVTLSRFAAIALPAWLIMLVFWPWAQAAPFSRPFQALSYFNTFPWSGAVLFHGKQMQASSLPRTYTLEWLGITLPEGVLVLLALAIVLGVRAIWINRSRLLLDVAPARYSFAVFALLFPLAYIFITRPVLYDAERHSLYLVPILICLCGASWAWVLARLSASSRPLAFVLTAAFVAYLGWHVSVLVRLHPQEYVFFNQTAGGLHGAAANYETDYWGNSYREAVNILVRHVQPERQKDPQKQYRVYMTSAQRVSATYYFPSYFSLTFTPKDADFFLATTRYNVQNTVDGCTVGAVERFGVPLAVIKDLRCSNPLPATAEGTLQGSLPKGW